MCIQYPHQKPLTKGKNVKIMYRVKENDGKKGFVLVALFIAKHTEITKQKQLFEFDTNYIPLQYAFMRLRLE